jgi:hypothetical protein
MSDVFVVVRKSGMPGQEMWLQADSAEVLLEELAKVLGAKVEFDWTDPEPDAGDQGNVYVHWVGRDFS